MFDILETTCSLVTSLLPTNLISKLEKDPKYAEKHMFAITMLITNIVLEAIQALGKGDYKSFDANPGDGGCQVRAIELRRLVQIDLQTKYASLEEKVLEIKKNVQNKKNNPRKQQPLAHAFFQEQCSQLHVSKEMEYIVHCYLSTKLRVPYYVHKNGVIMTKSDVSQLVKLSKKIDILDAEFRKKIVENNQKRLSILSVDFIRDSAHRITSLKAEEKALLTAMLSEEHTHLFTPDKKFEPKAFGCLFYEIKVLLLCLKEERGIICLKSIAPQNRESFCLFLQPQESREEFNVLSDQECSLLSPDSLVIVFTAVVNLEKREALERLKQCRFSDMVLLQAAKEAPYEPGSGLDDVKEAKAVKEIMAYQKKEAEIGNFFTLDHICLNRLDMELVGFKS